MDLKIFSETGQTTSMALETYQESSGQVNSSLMTQNIRSLKNLRHNKNGLSFSGNHRINEIVSQGFYELRIDMSDFAGESRYAVYRRFSVGDEGQGFKLLIEDYIGNAGCMSLDKN